MSKKKEFSVKTLEGKFSFFKFPILEKEGVLYIHPSDFLLLVQQLYFIDTSSYGWREIIRPGEMGRVFGLPIIIMDDIMLLLLAMTGGKVLEDKD